MGVIIQRRVHPRGKKVAAIALAGAILVVAGGAWAIQLHALFGNFTSEYVDDSYTSLKEQFSRGIEYGGGLEPDIPLMQSAQAAIDGIAADAQAQADRQKQEEKDQALEDVTDTMIENLNTPDETPEEEPLQ